MRITALLVTLVAIVPAFSQCASAATSPWAPSSVEALSVWTPDGAAASVEWTPGTQAADYYEVYGLDGTTLVFLAVSVVPTVTVPGGYSGYAVSAVLDGQSSEVVTAMIAPCAYIYTAPPGAAVGNCGTAMPLIVTT